MDDGEARRMGAECQKLYTPQKIGSSQLGMLVDFLVPTTEPPVLLFVRH